MGSLKPVPSFNEYGIDVTQTNICQDYEKRGFFQGNAEKFSYDDGSWTMFSSNEAFTLNTSTSGSTIPPPPPKVPHPSQLGSEAQILQGCFPVPENRGPRPVSLSPQPSISSTTTSDFTLSHMRQTSQSPKMDRSRFVSRSPQTIVSLPPPPPSVAHPRQCSDTSKEAPKTRHTYEVEIM